ncbi:hypothetical protein GDO81_028081 [Engystomops pustulosus]|uniref:Uncharacterized protein n=1 Tax=Engystomops pustulosus TaxID=76066 RepID=A0AAV6ZMW0_ENGPU|nr:hypothetical protein GDO81_028081 [Engystomops pustulosus]
MTLFLGSPPPPDPSQCINPLLVLSCAPPPCIPPPLPWFGSAPRSLSWDLGASRAELWQLCVYIYIIIHEI